MSTLIGAAICGLTLVAIFIIFTLPYAIAWGWLRVRAIVVVGKGFDISEEEQEELPEVCERPHVIDLTDPLISEIDEHAERTARIKERMKNRTPTLSRKGPVDYTPIKALSEAKTIEKDHKLQILN